MNVNLFNKQQTFKKTKEIEMEKTWKMTIA